MLMQRTPSSRQTQPSRHGRTRPERRRGNAWRPEADTLQKTSRIKADTLNQVIESTLLYFSRKIKAERIAAEERRQREAEEAHNKESSAIERMSSEVKLRIEKDLI